MQFSFDWQGVNILRVSSESRDCYMFFDKNGNEVLEHCANYSLDRLALQELKIKIVLYIKNKWVLPRS
jgi:hypothetical protein